MIFTYAKPAIVAYSGRRGPYAKTANVFIQRARLARGLTQPECAKFCGVSLRTFQRAESGDVVGVGVKRGIERALGAIW
jgi:hypothetical protein